jgi:hypothetical protein
MKRRQRLPLEQKLISRDGWHVPGAFVPGTYT